MNFCITNQELIGFDATGNLYTNTQGSCIKYYSSKRINFYACSNN